MFPAALFKQAACQIILVKALHDEHDNTVGLGVKALQQVSIECLPRASASGFRQRFVGLLRVVEYDDIGAKTGRDPVSDLAMR
jgi:hypothetical protein